MKVTRAFLILILALSTSTFAMKNRQRSFPDSCDDVWTASLAVAKSQNYRIVSVSTEEHVISLSAGGAWGGERMISLSLENGKEFGCVVTVQSRFSGLAHSDGPDLLSRIGAELVTKNLDGNSKAVRRYRDCIESFVSDSKCEERLRKDVAKASAPAPKYPEPARGDYWNSGK
jgi:hypothetical protein